MIIKCKHCKKDFKKYPSTNQKFCDMNCYSTFKRIGSIEIICKYCKRIIRTRNLKQKFCGKRCEEKHSKQRNHNTDKNPITNAEINCDFCSSLAVRLCRGKSYCKNCYSKIIDKGGYRK